MTTFLARRRLLDLVRRTNRREAVPLLPIPRRTTSLEERMTLTKRIERDVKRLTSGLATAVVAVVLFSIGCATVGTAPPWEVRAEDLRINSRIVYTRAMATHRQLSRQEPKEVYLALEALRKEFPKHHKEYVTALDAYQAVKGKDPAEIRRAGMKLLDALGGYGSAEWKATVEALRLAFDAGGGR